jgi:hypothetical protein
MPDDNVLEVLAAHWAETRPFLSADDLAYIADRVVAIENAADSSAARRPLNELRTLLALRLPADNPVSATVLGARWVSADAADLPGSVALLRALPGLESLLQAASGPAARELSGVQAGLLAARALTEGEVRAAGGDPGRADLIRLPRGDRHVVLPAFQFAGDGTPLPVVTRVNRLLDAAGDPWGVADWWLGRNAWLNGIPADLLGSVPDAELIMAARAELPEA